MKTALYFILILFILFIFAASFHYFFMSIYEIEYKVNTINEGSRYFVQVNSIPLNSLGYKAVFRKSSVEYKFDSLEDVEIKNFNKDEGFIQFYVKKSNKKIVYLTGFSKNQLLPAKIKIDLK